nr:protein SRG1-like [Tanacetum cinerariifolium]
MVCKLKKKIVETREESKIMEPKETSFAVSLVVPSVQELVKEPLTSVPLRYIRLDHDSPVISSSMSSKPELPIIDMNRLLSLDSVDSELEKLHLACRDWGFFQLINHEKLGDFEGFGQLFVVSKEQKLDWADIFTMITLPAHLRKPHLLPKLPQRFRDTIEEYSKEVKKVSLRTLMFISKALKMEDEEMKSLFGDGLQLIRINYYPPRPQPEQVIGLTPHSDGGGITLLLQVNQVEGLEIKKDGNWLSVIPHPNTFIVNIGDIMELVLKVELPCLTKRTMYHGRLVFSEKIASNLKFLNNLQPEWSRHVTIIHQIKDLHIANYTQLYDFLKYNQKEVDELKAERLAKTQDPLALMETSNNPYNFPVLSFNQNYMQQPMPNPEDITNPITAMNMALALMAKAFKLNCSTPTNNNQTISSNPCNRQIAQPKMNMGQDRQMQMVGGNANQNLNGNGNLVAARTEGNVAGHNRNQIRCYNCKGVGYFARNCTVRPRRKDAAYLQTQLLISHKEKAGIQLQAEEFDLVATAADLDEIEEVNANCILMDNLQQASTSGTQTDKAPVYDSDGSTENDNNVISEVTSVEQSGKTVEQHPANVEEKCALYDSLYQNLAMKVEKVNPINHKLKETNAELTTELSVDEEQCLSKKINALHLSSETHNWSSSTHQELLKIVKDENFPIVNQADARVQNFEIQFLKEAAKFVGDFKSLAKEADESLAKHKSLELEIERLLRVVVSQDIMSVVQKASVVDTSNLQTKLERTKERFENCIIKKENEYAKLWNNWYKQCDECKFDKISYDKAYKDMQQKIERLQAQLGDLKGKSKDTSCVSDTLNPLSRKLENENDNKRGTSTNTKFTKQSILGKPPMFGETHALSKPVTLNSVPTPQESKVMKNDKVITPGMFRINPFKTSREDKHVPNNVRASVRTKPITVSQPPVFTKKDVNSDSNGLSSTRLDNTKTRRPQPRSNTKNDRVPSASKRSRSKNKGVEVEEHHRNLLLSKNKKHMSSECNNVKLVTHNVYSKVVCGMCKQCLIFINHDECLLNYVNDTNSHGKKQTAKVSIKEKQQKQKPKVKKPKKVGSIERLATPKPSKPRSFLRWSPTGRFFDLKGKIITSTESKSQSNCSKGDNACSSNPIEPSIKRFPNATFSLACNSNMFIVRRLGLFQAHDQKSKASYQFRLEVYGNCSVYLVEGLGHNLFSVGQFCDSNLEVAFRRNGCFVRNLEGVDLLKGDRSTNLYTINLHEMAYASPICLMARASSTKSWLWHQHLSHLNFDTINDLAKNDLVSGLPKFKYHKEHLCPSIEQGKGKRASHPHKPVPNSRQRLHLLHMDLCGPIRIASINGKRNQTLVEAARTMLIFSRALLFLWTEAIATACFIQNRSIIHRRFNKTPYELINGRKPDISFLHVFGALCYPKNDRADIGKLGVKGDIDFFIGYSTDSCAYRVYNRRTKKIIETMNVSFDELSSMAFEQRSSKPWL